MTVPEQVWVFDASCRGHRWIRNTPNASFVYMWMDNGVGGHWYYHNGKRWCRSSLQPSVSVSILSVNLWPFTRIDDTGEKNDMTKTQINIDTASFTRLPEIVAYASEQDITVQTAIIRLVNEGLSHR